MGEKESEKEDKPKHYTVTVADTITLTDRASAEAISTISGSIKQGIDALRGTFTPSQNNMANSLKLDQNLEYLKKIADELEKSRKLAEQQRDEAIKDAKKERRNLCFALGNHNIGCRYRHSWNTGSVEHCSSILFKPV